MSYLKRQDWPLNLIILLLAVLSLVIISSISLRLFWQQFAWFVAGFLLILLMSQVDFRAILNLRWLILGIYFFAIFLLILTFIFAPTIRSAKSWLVIGPLHYQTSEFSKFALIIALAYFFSKRHIGIARISNLLLSFVYLLILVSFVLIQPDLGNAIILFGVWAGFLLVSGIRWRHLVLGLIILSLLGVFSWDFFLKDYQKERILALFSPSRDPLGINYSVIQSKIAIGSAGFFGKGYGQGTQVQLGFLPEAATDFNFSAFVEEWGFFGGLILIAAFLFLIFRLIKIGLEGKENFLKFVCLGTAILFLLQFALNTGSALGLLPIVGVTFPFFSYGGSSLLTNFLLVAIIQSLIARSRY
jgi:rod shape determining protein RodA